ncbi:MAG TPA: acyltransferase family protein [Acidimicrobiia bacterium]|nr:acyltransferase family protein [Acidimicrobiia bacterium]
MRLRYLAGIDGLRAISVLAVLVYHNYTVPIGRTEGPLPGGFLGVEVFFVISGYLITSLLLDERRRTGGVAFGQFWLRRARRLLPALFLVIAFCITWSLLFMPDAIESLKGDALGGVFYYSNWWQIAANHSYFAASSPELLKHLWSLAIEEQFYLVWPVVLFFGLRRLGVKRMVLAMFGVAALSVIVMWSVAKPSPNWDPSRFVYYATVCRMSGLLLGALLAFLWTPRRVRGRTGPGARWVLNLVGAVGLTGLFWSFAHFGFQSPGLYTRGGFVLVDILTVLVLAAIVHPKADWNWVLGNRPLVWIGLRSYGIYLWHYPLFWILTKRNIEDWIGFAPPNWLFYGLRFGVTIGIAELSFRFVEMPIRHGAIANFIDRFRASRGRYRRRLAVVGTMVVTMFAFGTAVLASGLANASPEQTSDDNIANHAAEEQLDPEAARADALAAARAAAASTTAVPATDTTTTVPAVPVDPNATTVPTAAPTTVAPPVTPTGVFAIGDSVMLGAKNALQQKIPGIIVDAVVSRQFAHAISVVQFYKDNGLLPPVVVVHLGTNGRFGDGEFDTMMATIGPERQAYFLTAREPRSWEAEVNATLTRGVQRHPNAHLIDWRQFSGCHSDWFARDGFHVNGVGAAGYAEFVNAHITNQSASLQYCP